MTYERILITGGSGRLGRFVVDQVMRDHDVTVLDLKPPAQTVAFREASILHLNAVQDAVKGQDAVIHLAGYDDGDGPNDKAYLETNVQGAWNVFHAAEAARVRHLVIASSTAAYGIGRGHPPVYLPVDEAHPQRPRRSYDLSKQMIETAARHFARRGVLSAVCLRPTLIVRPEKQAQILAQLETEQPDQTPPTGFIGSNGAAPYGALSPTRTYVLSEDCARAFARALDYDTRPFDVFNIAADDTIGRIRSLERLADVFPTLPEIRDRDYFADDPERGILSNKRARERLDWRPQGDWRQIRAEDSAKSPT